MNLHVSDWVEVRSRDEILRSLDEHGQLDGLPFMPEMLQFCGQRFQVWKLGHKTCDTVNKTGGRRMSSVVHLQELRCDGAAHGGCQAGCLLYWKEAWIKPVDAGASRPALANNDVSTIAVTDALACTERTLHACTTDAHDRGGTDPTFVCQTTRLPDISTPLNWWDIRQYWEDVASGNVGVGRVLSSFVYTAFFQLTQAGIGIGRPMRWLYDRIQSAYGGVPFPHRKGTVPNGAPTPSVTLDLQPGELVRVKSYGEILATLDGANRNRGLYFDCEEVPYCGRTFRVRSRVTRIINERTGKMSEFKTPSVILEGVYCQGWYSDRRLFCPRSIYPMWREAWLERVTEFRKAGMTARTATEAQPIRFVDRV